MINMLPIGQTAPDFCLPDADMEMVSLSSFRGKKNLVLYFYPKDDMPGCTAHALELSDLEDEFARFDTLVFGISRDDCLTHGSFRDKHGIAVRLLSDCESEACKKYDVLQEKKVSGETKLCVVCSTFIIDKCGILQHALYGAGSRNRAAEILGLVKEVSGLLYKQAVI